MDLTIKKNRFYFINTDVYNLGYTDQRTILRSLKKSLSSVQIALSGFRTTGPRLTDTRIILSNFSTYI